MDGPDTWVAFTYDAIGRLVSVSNPEQVLVLTWGVDGELITATPGGEVAIDDVRVGDFVVVQAADVEVGTALAPEPWSATCREPAELTGLRLGAAEVLVYAPVSGQWSVAPRSTRTGDSTWWSAGVLHRGRTPLGPASIESLRLADVTYELGASDRAHPGRVAAVGAGSAVGRRGGEAAGDGGRLACRGARGAAGEPAFGPGRALDEVTELPHREGGATAAGPCEMRGWPGTLQKCLESPIVPNSRDGVFGTFERRDQC